VAVGVVVGGEREPADRPRALPRAALARDLARTGTERRRGNKREGPRSAPIPHRALADPLACANLVAIEARRGGVGQNAGVSTAARPIGPW
jgi:hypothetical protein